MSKIDDILGDAYMAFQREANKPKAVAIIRDAIAEDPDLKIAGSIRLRELSDLINARGRRACHVSAITFDLLVAALTV